jgi:hypothetical protein
MAFDVGLAHPDLFAGVAPMCGQPRYHGKAYWPNAQRLPFYVVWGERMGWPADTPAARINQSNGNLANFQLFKEWWIPKGFPAVGVQYKGRGLEWFAAEVPDIFEWMAYKRRDNPVKKVGYKDSETGSEYAAHLRTLRATDNHFYWLGVVPSTNRLADGTAWNANTKEATVAARITGNDIGVTTSGIKEVTIWLGRGMIDFDKPVKVQVGETIRWNNKKVAPSLGTLLEDFYERGDRQRLYVARIDLKG